MTIVTLAGKLITPFESMLTKTLDMSSIWLTMSFTSAFSTRAPATTLPHATTCTSGNEFTLKAKLGTSKDR